MKVQFSTQPEKKLFKDLRQHQMFIKKEAYEDEPEHVSVYIKLNNANTNNVIEIDTGAYQRTITKDTEVLIVWVDGMTLDFGD